MYRQIQITTLVLKVRSGITSVSVLWQEFPGLGGRAFGHFLLPHTLNFVCTLLCLVRGGGFFFFFNTIFKGYIPFSYYKMLTIFPMLYDTSVYPTLHSGACASHSSTSILPPPRLAPTSLFSRSVSLLLIIFTSWSHYLDSTSKWYHTVFVILWLISLSIMTSRAIHVAANGKISFFLWLSNIPFYIYAPHLYPIFFPWMLSLLPYVGKQCCFQHWGACVFSSQCFCFFRYICSSGIAGSHGGFLIFCFVFLRSLHTIFHDGCTNSLFFFFHITRMVLHFEIGTPVQARWRGKYHVDALDQISQSSWKKRLSRKLAIL